jgi:hypothetical protein
MLLRQVLEIVDLVDTPSASGGAAADLLRRRGDVRVTVERVVGDQGATDFVKVVVPGLEGKTAGGDAPTMGIIGRLGGVGARPAAIGMVSDADGGVAALAAALKLTEMHTAGDRLPGDVIIATHVCPNAPTIPHEPVPFQSSPVDMAVMNRCEVDPAMDAILTIDTTKGNRVINHRGIAISPTVKEGWILRTSEDLLSLLQNVTGRLPVVFPLAMQDITPYGNDIYHLNSILQPATATTAPVVGVAITAEVAVPGCATGASQPTDVEMAARFAVEVAKGVTAGKCRFYDPAEFARLVSLYGSMRGLQTMGAGAG